MSDELVAEALKALRRADAGVETGPEAEIRALLAFRRQHRRHRMRRMAAVWSATGAIAAAVVLLLALPRPARKTPLAAAVQAPIESEAVAAPAVVTPPAVK